MARPLRLFLCCQQDLRPHPVPAYNFWADYFRGGLREAGHGWIEAPDCDWAEGLVPMEPAAAAAWRERTWSRAVDTLRREHARAPVDFFLSYLYPQQVLPGALAEIQGLGIPCVNFFCDNVREFRQVPEAFRGFDLHWVPEFRGTDLYRRAGLPWLHAPMACWVPPRWRLPIEQETFPAIFLGTRDEPRTALFSEAIRLGLEVQLYGVGWIDGEGPPSPPAPRRWPARLAHQLAFVRQHGWAALARKYRQKLRPKRAPHVDFSQQARPRQKGDEYWHILRESTVCLGVNRYSSPRLSARHPGTYSRLRDLEAPMAGACYLTEWTEGLDRLYDPGTEIETYRDAAELVEKTRALNGDPARRRRLRAAGQRRALSEHSIGRTIGRIAERLGLG